ncbi:expressed unknown protein [Seminavis robusta]|uniref:L domain-like protein n=1 Tax=Seminavis robusta TaxID=568900 RepID=A0A9N8F4A4_9STRA|nr:expressed unknown protein [Seminavis robusta]|eukprot:Sro2845_g338370.1 n/a (268) ;mRNA; r:10133-10936
MLTGTIPTEIAYLTELTELHLSRNALTGSLIPELMQMTQLQSIRLNANSLTGTIPPELAQELTDLQFLWLDQNFLTGTVPPSICALEFLNWDVDCDVLDCSTCYESTASPTSDEAGVESCDASYVDGEIRGDRCYAVDTEVCVTTYPTKSCSVIEQNFTYYNEYYSWDYETQTFRGSGPFPGGGNGGGSGPGNGGGNGPGNGGGPGPGNSTGNGPGNGGGNGPGNGGGNGPGNGGGLGPGNSTGGGNGPGNGGGNGSRGSGPFPIPR